MHVEIIKLSSGSDGIAKISSIALKMIPLDVRGVVVSRIGFEGFKALRDLGLKIYRFDGSYRDLEKHLSVRGLDLEEIDSKEKVDFSCPCCRKRGVSAKTV
jgi:predicted Fe-Mo cluster-binding NifX family protein